MNQPILPQKIAETGSMTIEAILIGVTIALILAALYWRLKKK